MKNTQELVDEFNSLEKKNASLILCNKEQNQRFYESLHTEALHATNMLERLQQEIRDVQSRIIELIEKDQESIPRLLEYKADSSKFLPQEIRETYEATLNTRTSLVAMKEHGRYLQESYNELESRLKVMNENQETMKELFSCIEMLDSGLKRIHEIVPQLQGDSEDRKFGFKIIRAQEEERRRVSREMHDGPAQAMANIVFLAEVCEKLIDIDSSRAKLELKELRGQILGCLDETRRIVFDLRPMTLDDLGLIPTIKRIAEMLKERTGIKVNVKLSGEYDDPFDSHIEGSLFRIIQESLNNVEKHSHASEAEISIDFQKDCISIVIKDDGDGFDDIKNDNSSECFGLVGMRERVSLLNGNLEIDSQKGMGTKISVNIPLTSV
jgi:two-component system sensor histidine kinase DegS